MSMKHYMHFSIITVLCLFITGCATERKVYSNYTMPPRVLKEVSQVDRIVIDAVKIDIKTNFETDEAIKNTLSRFITERMASDLYEKDFYKVGDILWGTENGGHAKLNDNLKMKGFPHGYESVSTEEFKAAKLIVTATLQLEQQDGIDKIETELVRTPYKTDRKDNVPYSSPDIKGITKRKVQTDIPFRQFTGKASISFSMTDKAGKKVYDRTFNDIKYAYKAGGNSENKALPTILDIACDIFSDPIGEAIKDISPYRVTKPLSINNDGDPKSVTLIKSLAFSDAIQRLEEVRSKTAADSVNYADLENMAILLEAIGDYNSAMDFYKSTLDKKKNSELSLKGQERITAVLQGKGELDKSGFEKKNEYESKDNNLR